MQRVELVSKLTELITKESKEDHVGLWSVVWELRRMVPEVSPVSAREITLEVLSSLLTYGIVVAGFPGKDGSSFNAWDVSIEEAIRKFEES